MPVRAVLLPFELDVYKMCSVTLTVTEQSPNAESGLTGFLAGMARQKRVKRRWHSLAIKHFKNGGGSPQL